MKTLGEIIESRTSYILTKQKEKGDKYLQSEDEIKKTLLERANKGIPKRYCDAELNDETLNKEIENAIKAQKGCYFYGRVGTGKTYLLYAVQRKLRIMGYSAIVWNVPSELAKLRTFFGKENEGEESVDYELKTQDILLIDDFGTEKQTDWNSEIMYRLLNHRYENMFITFFASNLSLQDLAERSGDRLASRIAEMCSIVKIDGDDRRIKDLRQTKN